MAGHGRGSVLSNNTHNQSIRAPGFVGSPRPGIPHPRQCEWQCESMCIAIEIQKAHQAAVLRQTLHCASGRAGPGLPYISWDPFTSCGDFSPAHLAFKRTSLSRSHYCLLNFSSQEIKFSLSGTIHTTIEAFFRKKACNLYHFFCGLFYPVSISCYFGQSRVDFLVYELVSILGLDTDVVVRHTGGDHASHLATPYALVAAACAV